MDPKLQEVTLPYGSELCYTLEVTEHKSKKGFKVELYSSYFDLAPRRYWVMVDGKPSAKLPTASKTKVLDLIRRWLVSH